MNEMELRVSEGSFEWMGSTVKFEEYISGFQSTGSQMRRLIVTYQDKEFSLEYNAFLENSRERIIEKLTSL
jgi:hypothetical protein